MSDAGRGGRAKLIMLAAFFAVPVVASYLAFYYWRPDGTVNYGELLPPRALTDSPLALIGGGPFRLSRLRGNWVLLIADSGRCDPDCQTKLYIIRQLRLTQGKNQDRIERVWLIEDDRAPEPALLAQHEGLLPVRAEASALLQQLPAQHQVADHIYLIDPQGNLMMRYPKDPDARRMVKDLARLLRVSGAG
jgi:cytochrome oxidase Cu insertion factor (SCO1/SenC/PrrC family)